MKEWLSDLSNIWDATTKNDVKISGHPVKIAKIGVWNVSASMGLHGEPVSDHVTERNHDQNLPQPNIRYLLTSPPALLGEMNWWTLTSSKNDKAAEYRKNNAYLPIVQIIWNRQHNFFIRKIMLLFSDFDFNIWCNMLMYLSFPMIKTHDNDTIQGD